MKVVINGCYGGYSLSDEALAYLGIPGGNRYAYDNDRTNPKLVECVEKLGTEVASHGFGSYLYVVEVPDDVKWTITDYDGMEQVEEVHRVWS